MEKLVSKTVKLNLVGINGDAFYILGAFRRQAKDEGWEDEEIDVVLTEAQSKDYNYLVATISNHCEPKDEIDNEKDTDYEN